MDMDWTPNKFGVIHDLICEAYHKSSVEEKLHEVLLKYRHALINLLKDQKKSSEHRAQLQKEKILTIKNVQQNANDEFINSTILLSDLFDIDEYKAAILLYYGMQQQARLDRTPYEAACYLYYTERSYLLESWKLIINGAYNNLLSQSIQSLFRNFIVNYIYSNDDFMILIIGTLKDNNKKIIELESEISKIKQEVPKTEQPNEQKSSSYLTKEKKITIHKNQINYLKDERKDLSFILLLISHFQQLSSEVTIEVLKLLKETDVNDDIAFYLQSIIFSSIKAKSQHHNEEEYDEILNQYHIELNSQKNFIEEFENIINPNTNISVASAISNTVSEWKSKKIRSAILLQWSLFNFFIPRTITQELNISEDHSEEMANEALHYGVFNYLKTCLEIIEHKDNVKLDKTKKNQSLNNIEGSLSKKEQEIKTKDDETIIRTSIIDDELKEIIYMDYEELVEVFIQKFNNGLIRTIKAREEDIDSISHITNSRNSNNNNSITYTNSLNDNGNDSYHAYSSFLKFITVLYSNRPDSGLHFWTIRYLLSFIRTSSEARTFTAKCIHFEMLTSLATGEKCATYTYHALEDHQDFQQSINTTLVTWSALFKALEFYSTSLRQNPEKTLPPQEIILLKEFLKLFKQVICYSSEAALKFYENYNAIYNIFSLLVCRIPVELKAILFDILKYFCISTGNFNTEISYQVFELMEKVQLLYINRSSTGNNLNSNQLNSLFIPGNTLLTKNKINPFQSSLSALQNGNLYQQSIPWKDHNHVKNISLLKSSNNGLLFELEEIESRNETYPEILSFINLLNVLVQNLCLSSINHVDYNRNSIGLEPYIEFVLEHVYLKVESRSYIHPKEKWMIIETCLNLFENCLATFDITNITISVNNSNNKNSTSSFDHNNNNTNYTNFNISNSVNSVLPPNTILSNLTNSNDNNSSNMTNSSNQAQSPLLNDLNIISHHPGYFILTQILSGSSILDKMFEILSIGVDSLNDDTMKTYMYPKSILHILRIFMQVFILQNKFLDQIVPEIINLNVDYNISPSMTYLDQLLLFNSDVIIKIAMLINCHKYHEICLYTIKIMYILSISPFFTSSFESSMFDSDTPDINRIVYLLSRCNESSQIINGFVEHIELDEPEHEYYYSNQYLSGMNLIQKSLFKNTNTNNSILGTLFNNKKNKYINLSNSGKLNYALSKYGEVSTNNYSKHLLNNFGEEEEEKPGIIHSVRLAIIDLLLKNEISSKNSPTLAHFLLGYDVKHSLCNSEISDPMVSTTQIACLHVILDLLRPIENNLIDNSINNNYTSLSFVSESSSSVENWINTIEPLTIRHPVLSEMCYELIYHLCVNPNTSSTTMRYLRTREDFFYRQIKSMPIHFDIPQIPEYSDKDINELQNLQPNMATLYAQIHQRAWLMKTIALELHTTTTSGRRSQTQRLLQVLFDIPQPGNIQNQDMEYTMDYNGFDYSGYNKSKKVNGNNVYEQPLVRMLEILNSLDSLIDNKFFNMNELFSITFNGDSSVSEPFTEEELSNIDFSSCLIQNERGCFVYDLRRVYSLLVESQEKGQINLFIDDIKYVLQKILVINHSRELQHARAHYIEAWRQIMETTFLECYGLLNSDNRGALLYEFISSLLNKMAKEADINVTESLSKVVVALMSQLTRGTENKGLTSVDFSSSIKYELPIDVLCVILRGILSTISQPGILATTRGFLYTVLLNYLEFTDKNEYMKRDSNFNSLDMNYTQDYLNEEDDNYLQNHYLFENNYNDIVIENQSIIESYGDDFLEVVCRDASDGPELWKNSAFALLDSLCKLNEIVSDIKKTKGEEKRHNYVLSFLVRRNFLSHFVGNLKRDDEKLKNIVQNNSMEDSIVSLFTFEAKMTLFLRICHSREGVKKLIENGILESLIDCSYLDYRPEIDSNFDTFLHPTSERYHQLLVPTLRLLVCIMSVVGKDNRIALSRMISFMNAHQDVIIAILKDKLSAITLTSLEEIFLVTALFPYLANDTDLMEKQLFGPGHISFHSLLLNLLSKYSLPERWINKLQPVTEFEKGRGQMTTFILGRSMDSSILYYDAQFFAKKICMNILSYAQVVTSNLSTTLKPIFTYAISPSKESEKVQGTSAIYPPPSLALLINFIRNTIDSYYQAVNDYKELSLRLKDIHNLTIEEINEIIYVFFDVDSKDYSPSLKQQLALNEIKKVLIRKSKEILALFYIIEHTLLLFWRHLQYYLIFYSPKSIDLYSEYNTMIFNRAVNLNSSDKGFNPTYEELEKLKMNAPLIFGPILNKLSQIDLFVVSDH
ncbi:hypothetical protein H8356DRAFT_1308894 [Neocallimastix lanati (nom. inval.)]|nr:hypothetical protein H8356DRAFT_1308894 [Neocallimastix sp. JGI-2020a]